MMGSINYLSCQTRMDISFACGALMRYLHNPSQAHIKGGKRILRYLAGTRYLAIKFESGYGSHSGWLFFLGGGVISSSSELQTTVALSTTESELYGLCMAAREAAWIKQLLKDLKYCDNDGKSSNGGMYADASKEKKSHLNTAIREKWQLTE
ncbi:hypothetical protein Golomagni_03988 [Golovinomyces magnicellulatus]|nr:hypothetical protein Golomagni_03988 [Golovinomyces magnicellulatus]